MFDINKFFQKFTKIEALDKAEKDLVSSTIQKLTNIDIQRNLSIKSGVIHLETSPIVRNEVLMHKSKILPKLLESGLKIRDIY